LLLLFRELIQAETVSTICEQNGVTSSRKRLCGRINTQSETGTVLGEFLSHGEAAALMANSKFSKVAASITNNNMAEVAEVVGDNAILGSRNDGCRRDPTSCIQQANPNHEEWRS